MNNYLIIQLVKGTSTSHDIHNDIRFYFCMLSGQSLKIPQIFWGYKEKFSSETKKSKILLASS